jgi:hypothetical protein
VRIFQSGLLALVVGAALASDGIAQSQFAPAADPADVYEYDVDKQSGADSDDAEEALRALRGAGSTAWEIQKVIAVKSFRFLTLPRDVAEKIASEASDRQGELAELRTAVEANALFHSALQREGLQSADIVAVAIDEAEGGLPSEKQVRIYLAD